MTVSLKHQKVSSVPDSGDPSIVQGSDWNSEHTLTCATGKVLGRTSSGTGAVEEIALTSLQSSITATGILKGAGAGSVAAATAGTDYVSPSVLGAASGVATLGADSKLTSSQIPDISIVTYLGSVASQAAMLALTGQQGDWCTRSDLGTNWIITGNTPSLISSWTQLSYPTAPVTSVNSLTGSVTLTASNVGAQPTVTVNGIVKGNGSGTLSAAVAKTDYAPATTGSAILKGDGLGGFSAATGGTDYQTAQSVTGIVKSSGTTRSAAVAGTDYLAPFASQTAAFVYAAPAAIAGTPSFRALVATDVPTLNQNTTGSAAKWTTARTLAGNSVDGSVNVTFSNKFIVQGTTDAGLSGAQFLGSLGTGLVKNTTTTGVLSIAASGTDYAPATSGSAILSGNGSGGFTNVTVGSGLSFAAGTLSATGGGMVYPGAGIPVSTGSAWGTSKTAPSGTLVGDADTQTLTNKRITVRIGSTTSGATITPTGDTVDQYEVTALATGATIAAPTGTPTDGQKLMLRLKDNGSARTLSWNATYRVIGVTLPTTTTAGKVTYVGCIYNSQDTCWDVVAVATQA